MIQSTLLLETFLARKFKALNLTVGVFHRLAVGPWANYLTSLVLVSVKWD